MTSDPTREALNELLARFREKGKRTVSGWEAVWAEQDTWDDAADELEDVLAALSTTPAPDRETTTTNLARHLHRKGVGCDGHRGNDPSTAHEMHRDDAYDLVDWFASIPPREEPLHDD